MPQLGTVLANEEVIDGKSEVGGHPVVRMPMKQWMLRITAYADRLIEDLDELDWPEPIKKMQRDWIGRSEGANVRFAVDGHSPQGDGAEIEVFTTRPDTLFGATYMVLAPEHALVSQITSDEQRAAVDEYVERSARRSERDRMADAGAKTGVWTGATAKNPTNGESIPIWIADYVLAGYGTGAIMAVPGHDERDWAFAKTFDLPIVEVVAGGDVAEAAHTNPGTATNSGFLDGLETAEAKSKMIEWLEREGLGQGTITYKLRDWLFSRQRYWGEPFPVVHHEDGSVALIPESDLPLTLPELDDFKPSGEGYEPPLARVKEWVETTDADGRAVLRDANTMPQWAGSCWYFLRFLDPMNDEAPWSGRPRSTGCPSTSTSAAPSTRCFTSYSFLAQGLLRPGPRLHEGALPEAGEPGNDPRRRASASTTTTRATTREGRPSDSRRRRRGTTRVPSRGPTAARSRRAGSART